MATNTSVNITRSPAIANKVSDRLYHEMHVSLSARDYNIHPDAHGLGRRRHHVVHSIVRLHAERQRGVGALCGRACKCSRGEGDEGTNICKGRRFI